MCIRPSYLALIKNESKDHNPPPAYAYTHTQTPIVTVFIYIVCRFWVCIGTGLILTGRTNSSPERVWSPVHLSSTSKKKLLPFPKKVV